MQDPEKFRVALVGQPNVGKSSLLNALVGPRVTVSNYPGTTVEVTKAKKKVNDVELEIIDTPGIYSISDQSKEEKITEEVLFEGELDGAIVIVDALSLERGLYMVLQILEGEIPTVLAINFTEDAKKRGIEVDYDKLEQILNIPVIPINPLRKKGIANLLDAFFKMKESSDVSFSVEYDDHIEDAITRISSQVRTTQQPERFVALRALEEDKDFYKYLESKKVVENAKEPLVEHPNIAEDIAVTRYGTASFIAEKVTQIVPIEEKSGIKKKLDDLLLHEVWGPVVTGLTLLGIFGMLLVLGNFVQDILMSAGEQLLTPLTQLESSLIVIILTNGVSGLVAGVSIALPYVFLFYFLLGLLEDTGILSRFIVNTERLLRKMGLPGKAFIPLALGLGCTAPATRATRVLSTNRDQTYASSLFAFVPCSSRMAIIMGIIGYYGGIRLAFSLFATLLIAGLLWALAIKNFFYKRREPLLLELPPYRRPLLSNVLAKSWIRMKDFVYVVMPLLALGGIFYGFLASTGLTRLLIGPLSPITTWLRLPEGAIIPLVFGFLQKDLTGAMLISVLGGNISAKMSYLQLYTFGVASTIGIPCIIALGTLATEIGGKKAAMLTIVSIAYGLLVAGLVPRIIGFL